MKARHRPGIHVGGVLGRGAIALVLLWAFSIDRWPGWLQWCLGGAAGVFFLLSAVFNRKVISQGEVRLFLARCRNRE